MRTLWVWCPSYPQWCGCANNNIFEWIKHSFFTCYLLNTFFILSFLILYRLFLPTILITIHSKSWSPLCIYNITLSQHFLASHCIPHTYQGEQRELGNLALRHFVLHFPPNSGGIACWVPWTSRVYSRTLVSIRLKFRYIFNFGFRLYPVYRIGI